VYRDVVGMPIQAVLVEGDDEVWLEAVNGAEDIGLEERLVDPREHAILVIEHYDVVDTEDAGGLLQLARTNVTKSIVLVTGTVLSMREAEK